MQVFESGVDSPVEQSLESFFVQGQLQEVPPGQSSVFLRELAILFEQAAELGDVELSTRSLLDCISLFVLSSIVEVDRMVKLLVLGAAVRHQSSITGHCLVLVCQQSCRYSLNQIVLRHRGSVRICDCHSSVIGHGQLNDRLLLTA